MNKTAGPSEISPVLLVFGVHPRLPLLTLNLPEQRERMRAMATAKEEMIKVMAEKRLLTSLTCNVLSAANKPIEPGCKVLVYREGPKEWIGRFQLYV